MNSYQVVFLDNDNQIHKNILFATSKKDLIATLAAVDIFDESIMSINYNPHIGNHYLALERQIIILIKLSAVISADMMPTLYEIARQFKHKRYIIEYLINNKYDLATILSMLDFSEHILEIIKTSQKTGQSATSIDLSIDALEEEIDLKKTIGNAIFWMKFKLLFVTAILLPIPLYIEDFFNSSIKSGLTLETNKISDFLFFINDYYFETGILLLLLFVLFFVFKNIIWQRIIYFYPFNIINDIDRGKNTLLLLNLLIPNHQFGVIYVDTIRQYRKISKKTKIEADKIIGQIDDYQTGLSEAVKITNLSAIFKDGMSSFDQTKDTKGQLKTLKLLRKISRKELNYNNQKLTMMANIISGIAVIIAIIVIFGGFILPKMTAGINL